MRRLCISRSRRWLSKYWPSIGCRFAERLLLYRRADRSHYLDRRYYLMDLRVTEGQSPNTRDIDRSIVEDDVDSGASCVWLWLVANTSTRSSSGSPDELASPSRIQTIQGSNHRVRFQICIVANADPHAPERWWLSEVSNSWSLIEKPMILRLLTDMYIVSKWIVCCEEHRPQSPILAL